MMLPNKPERQVGAKWQEHSSSINGMGATTSGGTLVPVSDGQRPWNGLFSIVIQPASRWLGFLVLLLFSLFKIIFRDFSGSPVVKAPHFHCKGQPLVGELRSRMLHDTAKKIFFFPLFFTVLYLLLAVYRKWSYYLIYDHGIFFFLFSSSFIEIQLIDSRV